MKSTEKAAPAPTKYSINDRKNSYSLLSNNQDDDMPTHASNKKLWRFFVIPVIFIISLALFSDWCYGLYQCIAFPGENKQTWHWLIELLINFVISFCISIGANVIRNQVKRR